jgi:hypothetical protein
VPTYNHFTIDGNNQPSRAVLLGAGPTIQIEVSIHPSAAQALQASGQPIPAPVTGAGLIDTGAGVSVVDINAVVGPLKIPPIGTRPIHGVGGVNSHLLHAASFRFPATTFPPVNFAFVVGADLAPQGIIALIGRDVLMHFVMIYNGVFGQYTLCL